MLFQQGSFNNPTCKEFVHAHAFDCSFTWFSSHMCYFYKIHFNIIILYTTWSRKCPHPFWILDMIFMHFLFLSDGHSQLSTVWRLKGKWYYSPDRRTQSWYTSKEIKRRTVSLSFQIYDQQTKYRQAKYRAAVNSFLATDSRSIYVTSSASRSLSQNPIIQSITQTSLQSRRIPFTLRAEIWNLQCY